jgi:hypothetical protein
MVEISAYVVTYVLAPARMALIGATLAFVRLAQRLDAAIVASTLTTFL